MNSNAHLHLAQQRAEHLRQEARQDHLARLALAARPAAPERPAHDLRALLVRLHLA
ncbi:hypothetical protein [Deinococcus sp. KSM4-11]|uniref:hypothetical protein n=1 Tax=Deinococcus sp. KSM4-11 TaxID=2568654 RepID=UPI001454BE96|nr:hypothetical protein [Deinococcus sp. KSM4-11]